jgi:PHD/YefM family antitoxin component YafN of YafNO toxin-antitoxin module
MTVQTVKLGGQSFVIVSEKDFRRLQQRAEQTTAQDRGDLAESRRRMKESGGKTLARIRTSFRWRTRS